MRSMVMTLKTPLLLGALALLGCGQAGQSSDAPGGGGGGGVGFGGAQDIGQFRGLLAAGEIPGPATLDANGFFSEHRTELPPPDCGDTLCANGMLAVGRAWLDGRYQATLQVAINTPIDPSTLVRRPLNLVVVVDTSGSMASDNRIGYVRDGLHLLVDELQEGDSLALISYSQAANVRRSFDDQGDAASMHALIDTLQADGSTNIYDGLELGFEEASIHFDAERQNRVILLSDGLATAGITSDEEILRLSTSYISDGIGLTTIGVGRDFNVELMRGLAERGAGNFYFIESADAVTEVFTEELNYFVTPIGLGVTLSVATAPGYNLGDVTGTRLWKTTGNSGEMLIPAVFLASRTDNETPIGRRGGGSALFLDVIPEVGIESPGPVATITLAYNDPATSERVTQTIVVDNGLAPGELGEDLYVTYQAMVEHYAIYNTYLGLLTATQHAAASNYNCAVAALDTVRSEAATWNQTYEDSDIAADLELFDQFKSNLVAAGANRDATTEGCEDPNNPDDWDDGWGEGDDIVYHCSAGGRGGLGGFLLVLGVAFAASRRRRRTSV